MADPYSAGQALGSALFGSTQDTYTNQLGRQYQVEQALQQARQARSKAMLAQQVNDQRALVNPELVNRLYSGDQSALGELGSIALLANDNLDASSLSDVLGASASSGARNAALGGDYNAANANLFALAKGPQQLATVEGQNLLGNRFLVGGGDVSTTEQGRAGMAADAARARASDASAASSYASAARTRQGMALDRADVLGGGGGRPSSKAPSGYRWNAAGDLEFVPGGPADPANKGGGAPSEDERKAAGWLGQATRALGNMEASLYRKNEDGSFMLDSLGKKIPTGADTPGFIERYSPSDELGNRSMSPDRQRYSNASSSLSEALLRAATGAGVNESEARQKVAELTPQRGDSEEVKKQKLEGAAGYIEDLRARAGRALPAAQRTLGDPAPPPSGRKRYNAATGRLE